MIKKWIHCVLLWGSVVLHIKYFLGWKRIQLVFVRHEDAGEIT